MSSSVYGIIDRLRRTQERKVRITRTRQPGEDCQHRTARQENQGGTTRKGQAGQDSHDKNARTGLAQSGKKIGEPLKGFFLPGTNVLKIPIFLLRRGKRFSILIFLGLIYLYIKTLGRFILTV
jgi:hypothetical protein